MIAPLATLFELTPISYMPPAWSLNLSTSSLRSAISPWLYQYVRLALFSSGGWPAASAADSLANCCGEPGIDCHSTLTPFWRPHSTKVSPTALSVIPFQLAENQTLKTPDAGAAICAAGVAAAAGAEVGAGAAPAGGAVGWGPPPAGRGGGGARAAPGG